MRMTRFVLSLELCTLIALSGCGHKEHIQANAPPQGYAPEHPGISDYFAYHNDQGMIADMSIADIHFIPHSADLSGTGAARLERYAELLATNGGTLYYDTALEDHALVDQRLATAKAYLTQCTTNQKPIEVVLGMAGGPGMRAKESIAGAAEALQPEKRDRAYHLQDKLGSFTSSGGGQ